MVFLALEPGQKTLSPVKLAGHDKTASALAISFLFWQENGIDNVNDAV
jgi:hypothetical protein